MSGSLIRRGLHAAVWAFHSLRRALWFFSRPATRGAHGVALTPAGKLILVTLSYARGWRVPGGGVKRGEGPKEAVLRELREEIGMTSHGAVRRVMEFSQRPDFKRDTSTLFVIEDVVYEPKWSLEVKAVREFDPRHLPEDAAPSTRRLVKTAKVV